MRVYYSGLVSFILHSALLGLLIFIGHPTEEKNQFIEVSLQTVQNRESEIRPKQKIKTGQNLLRTKRHSAIVSQPLAVPSLSEEIIPENKMGAVNSSTSSTTGFIKLEARYLGELINKIEENKHYPGRAKRDRQCGEVKVGFTIMKNGTLNQIRLIKSLVYELLNEAALDAVQRVGRISPIPSELGREQWEVALPIRFELKD